MTLDKADSDRYATIDGVELHYNDVGSGPALMTFHGGGPGANGWDNTRFNVPELSQHFRMLLVDLPGYGGSDKTATLPEGATVDGFLSGLMRGLLDHLGIETTHLYCSSFSGPFGVRFGLDYPDRIGKLVLQATYASTGLPLMLSPTPAEGIKTLMEFREEPTYERMQRMMDYFIPNPALRSKELVDRRYAAATIPGHLEAAARFGGSANMSNLQREAANLKAETLLLWGGQDWMVPVEGVLRALGEIPNLRVHIWRGAGHFVQYEHRDEFNRLVLDFLTH